MFDGWAILRDDQVIREGWIVYAVALELFAAIESFGRWRHDFDDYFRVDDHIAILIEELHLSAYDHQVGIRVESFLRVTPSRQRSASAPHIFCERLAASSFQL